MRFLILALIALGCTDAPEFGHDNDPMDAAPVALEADAGDLVSYDCARELACADGHELVESTEHDVTYTRCVDEEGLEQGWAWRRIPETSDTPQVVTGLEGWTLWYGHLVDGELDHSYSCHEGEAEPYRIDEGV